MQSNITIQMELTESVRPWGSKGWQVVNGERYAIIKQIDDFSFVLCDNLQKIYYLDVQKCIFELIHD